MKQKLSIMFSLLLLLPVWAFNAQAISMSEGYSTSFECSSLGTCLDFDNMEGSATLCGEATSFPATDNNPLGSGNAMKIVVGDGINTYTYTGGYSWSPGVPELWVRYYIRYEKGFTWSPLSYDKLIYVRTQPFYSSGTPSPIFEWYNANDLRLYLSIGSVVDTGVGWQNTMGGSTGDGQWHAMEFHLKTDTGKSDGVYQAWIDGKKVADHSNVNFNQSLFYWFTLYSNQRSPANVGGCGDVWIDDVAVYASTPPNVDAEGNPFIGTLDGVVGAPAPPPPQDLLFEEAFESTDLAVRGWYDNTAPVFTSAEAVAGSTRSIEFLFNPTATTPVNGGAMRRKFPPSDSVYIRYYVKYSANWVGSQKPYHPHEFQIMTNKDGDWTGMAYTYLTAYVEQNALRPRLAIQDGRNIDLNNLNVNLVELTEARSVAGCNGDSDGHGDGSCYAAGGGTYWNDKHWVVDSGGFTPGRWHKVEAFFKLNSIESGKGVADGIMRYWLDDQLLINHNDIMFRTAQHADMQFDKLIIAPWIGDGSPIEQTFWIDDLVVAVTPPETNTAISPPKNLRLVE